MDPYFVHAIDEIADDHVAGAVEVAERSADLLLRQARIGPDEAETLRRAILEIAWGLINAQPTMAPLVNLVNGVLWRLDNANEPRQAVAEAIVDFKRHLRIHEAAIAEKTLPLIPEGARIITLGRSTTVRGALLYAQRAGRHFSVICSEGRPGCEGRDFASELAAAGVAVTLVIDVMAINLTREVQLVLVGADHLTATGLVNKIGTYGLALAAQASKTPIYALCGSEKFLPNRYTLPEQASWPDAQVWSRAPEGVAIENHYFDHTPLTMVNGIVTEQGVLSSEGLEAWLAAIHLHPTLAV